MGCCFASLDRKKNAGENDRESVQLNRVSVSNNSNSNSVKSKNQVHVAEILPPYRGSPEVRSPEVRSQSQGSYQSDPREMVDHRESERLKYEVPDEMEGGVINRPPKIASKVNPTIFSLNFQTQEDKKLLPRNNLSPILKPIDPQPGLGGNSNLENIRPQQKIPQIQKEKGTLSEFVIIETPRSLSLKEPQHGDINHQILDPPILEEPDFPAFMAKQEEEMTQAELNMSYLTTLNHKLKNHGHKAIDLLLTRLQLPSLNEILRSNYTNPMMEIFPLTKINGVEAVEDVPFEIIDETKRNQEKEQRKSQVLSVAIESALISDEKIMECFARFRDEIESKNRSYFCSILLSPEVRENDLRISVGREVVLTVSNPSDLIKSNTISLILKKLAKN